MVKHLLDEAEKLRVRGVVDALAERSRADIIVVSMRASGPYRGLALVAAFLLCGAGLFGANVFGLIRGPAEPLVIGGIALTIGAALFFLLTWLFVRVTPVRWRCVWVHRSALREFARLKSAQSEERPSLLIYLSGAERQLELLVDPALASVAGSGEWQEIVDELPAALRSQGFCDALMSTLWRCGKILTAKFPLQPDTPASVVR